LNAIDRSGFCGTVIARGQGGPVFKRRKARHEVSHGSEVPTKRFRHNYRYRGRWDRDVVAGIVVIIGMLVFALAYLALS
jgi:hypothetical protein